MVLAALSTAVMIATIAISLISIGITLLRKPEDPVNDDDRKSISYATRGAYINYLIGRQRVAPIVAWVSPNDATSNDFELVEGGVDAPPQQGKGSPSIPSAPVYSDRAIHVLAVGPGKALHRIYQNGKLLWDTKIDPTSHPSGINIFVPDNDTDVGGGIMALLWGYRDDPALTSISGFPMTTDDPSFPSARFPLSMKVVWITKKLGSQKTWPRLEYEIETDCLSSLTGSPAHVTEAYDDSRPTFEEVEESVTLQTNPPNYAAGNRARWRVLGIVGGGDGNDRERYVLIGDSAQVGTTTATNAPLPGSGSGVIVSGPNVLAQTDLTPALPPGGAVKLSGASATVGDSRTLASTIFQGQSFNSSGEYLHIYKSKYVYKIYYFTGGQWLEADGATTPPIGTTYMRGAMKVYLGPRVRRVVENQSAGSTTSPECYPVYEARRAGVNPIHMLDHVMFQSYPWGAGMRRKRFDMQSFEEAAWWMHTNEEFRGSYLANSGEDARQVIGKILTDVGALLSFDPRTGRYFLRLIRHPGYFGQGSTTMLKFPLDAAVELPEIDNTIGLRPVDKLLFTVKDGLRNYRDNPIMFNSLGQAVQEEAQRTRKIRIDCTTDYKSATAIARRRAQEESVNQSVIQIEMQHQARVLAPGINFYAPDIVGEEIPLRVVSVKRPWKKNTISVTVVPDSYDPPLDGLVGASSLLASLGLDPSIGNDAPEQTLNRELPQASSRAALELPKLASGGKIKFLFASVRTSSRASAALAWISRDNNSYTSAGSVSVRYAGAQLTTDLGTDVETGMVISSVSCLNIGLEQDFQSIEDLSSSQESWKLGRQIAVVEDEIMYLESASPDGDAEKGWFLQNLIRGRLGTEVKAHAAGSPIYIFRMHEVTPISHALFLPDRQLYSKVQQIGSWPSKTLDSIPAVSQTIQGKAIKPVKPGKPWLSAQRLTHDVNENVTINWNYTTSSAGCGMVGAGDPQIQDKVVLFDVWIVDPLSVNDDYKVQITDTQFSFTSALRSSLGYADANADQWTVKVRMIENGYVSEFSEATFSSNANP